MSATKDQRLANLRKANIQRTAISAWRSDIEQQGSTVAIIALSDGPGGMTVDAILRSIPLVARVKAERICLLAHVHLRTKVRELTDEQVEALTFEILEWQKASDRARRKSRRRRERGLL